MNKKTKIAILGVIALVLVTIGVTYAYWLITRTQTGQNEITTGCLDIAISGEKNDITLTNQFPMSDEEGMELVPYEFTVTNNCNTSVDYQVALEATGDESSAIATSSLKVALNDSVSLLSSNAEVETTVSGAYESRAIGYSRLAASGSEGSSDTYSLRIWIDEEAPISEMNKTFTSKISVTVGQGIESPYEEGTLAYSILANYGGVNAISEIDQTIYAHTITATGDQYVSTTSNNYYGTEYTYDETTGKYTLSGTLTQATLTQCRDGYKTIDESCVWNSETLKVECDKVPVECGKYTLKNTSSTYSSATLYEVTDFQSSGDYVTANTINYLNEFGVSSENQKYSGLHKTQDDLGDSYYFRGAPTNNYVEFGTYAEDTTLTINDNDLQEKTINIPAGSPMYWRIVRINGDGTVRLIYDGTELVENGTTHTTSIEGTAYSTKGDDPKYVGYTYDDGTGTQVDSTIKGVVDVWYDTYLETNYGSYIADSIFCNDREVTSGTEANPTYAPYDRLGSNKTPVLTCTNKSDRYTVSDTTNGNGLLSNPIGLITADEISFAGGTTTSNMTYYLYSGENNWTMSPGAYGGIGTRVWIHYPDGRISSPLGTGVTFNMNARPVINLKADVEFTGDGTIDSPYKIVME